MVICLYFCVVVNFVVCGEIISFDYYFVFFF
jgi:hypothetical protein